MFYRALIFIIFLLASIARAQPVPNVTGVSPDTLLPNQTTNVTLFGDNIANSVKVILPDPQGLSIDVIPTTLPTKATKELKLKVTVKPDATRGQRDIRVVTPFGVSAPYKIRIDDFASIAEKEPNNAPQQTQEITLPTTIVGAIHAPTEVDYFKFKATQGQRLIFDVQAQRTGSRLDSSLSIIDPATGKDLAKNEDANGLDSLIDFTVPADGEYLLRIQDLKYAGGGDFTYRLRCGNLPYVDSIFPLGGRRGGLLTLEVLGRNLASPRMNLVLDPAAPLGRREVQLTGATGTANPRPFEVSDVPELIEAEPNDATSVAIPATMPAVINGRINQPGDVDTYRFRSPTTRPVVFEVAAYRYGSPVDALLTLRDQNGNILQHNDDAMGADARIQIADSKDKEYFLSVTDLLNRGGDNFAYRLSIREVEPEGPDFEIVFPPETPSVARFGKSKLFCEVRRKGGFAGDVKVELKSLPPGISCEPLIVTSKDPTSGLLILSALPEARPGLHEIDVVATGRIGDQEVTRTLRPRGYSNDPRKLLLTVMDTPPFVIDRVGPGVGEDDPKLVAQQVAALKQMLDVQTPALDAGQAKWEEQNKTSTWQPLELVHGGTRERGDIKPLPDGSWVVSGENPLTDVSMVTVRTNLKNITAFKLEAVASSGKGPGRAPDGNFVISRFKVSAAPNSNTGAVADLELHKPRADFNQDGFNVSTTLTSGNINGWAISPRTNQSHWAIWETKTPFPGHEGGTTLTFTIDHRFPGGYGLRQFRILATTAAKPDENFSLPSSLLNIVSSPADKRTDQQKKELARYYRSIAPELQDVRDRLSHLRMVNHPFPPKLQTSGPMTSTNVPVTISRLNGFAGPVTLSIEGFTPGIDPKTNQPNPITPNLATAPVVVNPNQTLASLNLRSNANTQKATRTIVIKAEAQVDGVTWTQYSPLIPITVEAEPKKEEPKQEQKKS